jgi:ABC-type nitrate/sulfonate/bicarbonate transport system substrate-binding protein
MSLAPVRVMYGHPEGTEGKFARDPSGYLSIDSGIYRKYGLEVSWQHVQGTEQRYHRLEDGRADISFVVGRASLQHFLDSRTTKILGCAMNSCPYYLVAEAAIESWEDFEGKIVACREGPSRNTRLAEIFRERGQLTAGENLQLELPNSDQEAFSRLIQGKVDAALLPRPYGFIAEEKGFRTITDWPDVVDDPLPITIETTEKLVRERETDFQVFLAAHREGVQYLKSHRAATIRMLQSRFAHSPSLAAKTFDQYLVSMDERLTVDFKQLEKLLSQMPREMPRDAQQVASDWIVPGALRA